MFAALLLGCQQGSWVDVGLFETQVCAINEVGALRCWGPNAPAEQPF